MEDERFYRCVLDNLATSSLAVSDAVDLGTLGARLVEEISDIDQKCFSTGLQICMDVPDTSLTVEQIDALIDGVQSPTTIYGHARLVACMGSIVAEQRRILDAVDGSVLDQSQEPSQSDSDATRDEALQSSLREQRSASTEQQSETNLKRCLTGRTKKQSQTGLEIRKRARIAK